jgi:Leucine-rich repeat (LRR) protein
MSTLSCALIIVAIILLTCMAVNAVNQQKEYATTAVLGLGAAAVGALAVNNMNSVTSEGEPNIEAAQHRIRNWDLQHDSTRGELNLSGLELEVLPELPNGLKILNCSNNNLKSLPNLPDSLTGLYCSNNKIQSLPDLPGSLTKLDCSNNYLKSLPNLPDSLTALYCNNNQLQSLPNLPDSLTNLDCNNNKIQSLPDLPGSLTGLYCSNNEIICLPDLPEELTYLVVSGNDLQYPPSNLLDGGLISEKRLNELRKYMEENPERPPECNLTS